MFHCQAKSVSRTSGRSATGAGAYRSGEKIKDERTGEVHDYTQKQGVLYTNITAPDGVSIESRQWLWNQAEQAEKRKDAKVAREWELALPNELNRGEQVRLVNEFADKLVERYGIAVDICIHAPHPKGDQRNYHAHLLTTTRQITPDGLTTKTRELDSPKTSGQEVEFMREFWADCCNRAYERNGLDTKIDHRSFERQGKDQIPTIHLGATASTMERRGIETDRGDINREIKEVNAATAELERINAEIEVLQKEEDRQATVKKVMEALRRDRENRAAQQREERRQWKEKIDKAFEDAEKNPNPKGIEKEIKERLDRLEQENVSKYDELNIQIEVEDLYKVLFKHQAEADKRQKEERRAEKEAEGQNAILEREFAHCYKYGLTPESGIEDARNVFDKRMLEENKEYAKEKERLSNFIKTRGESPSMRVSRMREDGDSIKRRLESLKDQYQELKQEHDGKIFFGKKKLAEQMEKVKGQYQNAIKRHEGISKELGLAKRMAAIEEKHGNMFGDSPEREHWAEKIIPAQRDYQEMKRDLQDIDERMEKAPPSFYRNKEAVREAALKKLREDRAKEKERSKGFER